jgi:hypothetical protein
MARKQKPQPGEKQAAAESSPQPAPAIPFPVVNIAASDLDDRQVRGLARFRASEKSNTSAIILNDSTTLWMSARNNRAWQVKREIENHRGTLRIAYECTCGDWDKNGRLDCQHIFAERLRRGEVVVDGDVSNYRIKRATGARRPPRKRVAENGRPWRSVQRQARVDLPDRIPELLRDLGRAMEKSK